MTNSLKTTAAFLSLFQALYPGSAAELNTGMNIAAPALATGPIAGQVKAVRTAIKAKNDFFHDKIFRGVVFAGGVPDFLGLSQQEIEAKREAALKKRMEKLPELFAAIWKSLIIQPPLVEIVHSPKTKRDHVTRCAPSRRRDMHRNRRETAPGPTESMDSTVSGIVVAKVISPQ